MFEEATPKEVVRTASKRGLALKPKCHSAELLAKLSKMSRDDFWTELAYSAKDFKLSELIWTLQNMQELIPDEIVEKFIAIACETPQGADHLLKSVLTWSEQRQRIYFRAFIQLYRQDSLKRLQQLLC